MDRNTQPRYNLRSFGQNMPTASGTSSTSTGSDHFNASKTPMTTSQFQPNGAHTSQATANEPRPLWAQNQPPMADSQNVSEMKSSQDQDEYETTAALYPHTENKLGGPAATAPFLRDFTLVAEAVKRVQMELVMNEMESIRL